MIGEEVRRRREELGLTGAQLAERAGMAPSAVSQIETGKRTPSSTSVLKLAGALGAEVGELFPKVQAPLPNFEDERREDIYEMVLTAARRQANQDRQAATRALESERPQTYFMRHQNDVVVRLLDHSQDELAGTLVEMARRCVELEEQLEHRTEATSEEVAESATA